MNTFVIIKNSLLFSLFNVANVTHSKDVDRKAKLATTRHLLDTNVVPSSELRKNVQTNSLDEWEAQWSNYNIKLKLIRKHCIKKPKRDVKRMC